MKELEERILKDGKVYPGHILKVDSFLNHQVDMVLMEHIGEEIKRLFADEKITKVLTIEASGIVPAAFAAKAIGVPMIFAKKKGARNTSGDFYESMVHSYTYQKDYYITVSKDYIQEGDRVLLIDDFLANGKAGQGLIDIVRQAGAKTVGLAVCIEKAFQSGGKELREMGYKVESLAMIESMDDESLTFVKRD